MNLKYNGKCDICGFEGGLINKTRNNKFDKRLCKNCYDKIKNNEKYIRKYKNKIELNENYAEIIFYNKTGDIYKKCKIDLEDVKKIGKIKWSLLYSSTCENKYVVSFYSEGDKKKTIFLHRFLIKTPIDMYTDHINGDIYDNRKINLRIVTPKQNSWNCKPKKIINGVKKYKTKDSFKYRAYITIDGVWTHIGMYDSFNEAYEARKQMEIKLRGEYSPIICRNL